MKSFRKKPPALVLRVHKEFAANFKLLTVDVPIVNNLMMILKFKKFIGSLEKNFGFDDVLKRIGEGNGFVKFVIGRSEGLSEIGNPSLCYNNKYEINFGT